MDTPVSCVHIAQGSVTVHLFTVMWRRSYLDIVKSRTSKTCSHGISTPVSMGTTNVERQQHLIVYQMPIRLDMEVIKVEGKGWWVCVELGLNICDQKSNIKSEATSADSSILHCCNLILSVNHHKWTGFRFKLSKLRALGKLLYVDFFSPNQDGQQPVRNAKLLQNINPKIML